MLRVGLRSIVNTNRLLLKESRATYIRGYWPEPITQQTLDNFLEDINYFDRPKQFTNIGLDPIKLEKSKDTNNRRFFETNDHAFDDKIKTDSSQVDEILDLLGHDADMPPLDFDDCRLRGGGLVNLAIDQGIFRDLFGEYIPDREHIKFTPEQAERLSKLVPFHWITDQPFARVGRGLKEPEPMKIFNPLIGISARFVQEQQHSHDQQDSNLYAHTSYYGNIIPASEALNEPSITLDGRLLSSEASEGFINESAFNNWTPGQITTVNFTDKQVDKFYSIALVNLDHLHESAANLHWMLTNIQPSSSKTALTYEKVCDYLPVHGIRGYGYSRYVFIVFQHDSQVKPEEMKIQDFSLKSRRFDANLFLKKHQNVNMRPAGLSWFQTTWDHSSNSIFHNYLKFKAPTYEHVQTKMEQMPAEAYPKRLPFNIYLDRQREKKDINEQVFLERLSTVDPFDYKDQYVPPKVPPTIHEDTEKPSWMRQVMFKKNNKIGYWRGLRPSSMTLPLDNNADLDYPLRPITSSKKSLPEFHNQYPAKIKYKMHKDMPTSKPINEHQNVFVQDDHEIHLDKVMKVMEEFERSKS